MPNDNRMRAFARPDPKDNELTGIAKYKHLQYLFTKDPTENLDMAILDVMEKDDPAIYRQHLDVDGYLATRAKWLECTEANELTFVPAVRADEHPYQAYERSLNNEKLRAQELMQRAAQIPAAAAILHSELEKRREEREQMPSYIRSHRLVQQKILVDPALNFDAVVLDIMANRPAAEYADHIDVEGYWRRRAGWADNVFQQVNATDGPLPRRLGFEYADAQKLLASVERVPEAARVVQDELAKRQENRPRFAFDMTPAQEQYAQNRTREKSREFGDLGRGFLPQNGMEEKIPTR